MLAVKEKEAGKSPFSFRGCWGASVVSHVEEMNRVPCYFSSLNLVVPGYVRGRPINVDHRTCYSRDMDMALLSRPD